MSCTSLLPRRCSPAPGEISQLQERLLSSRKPRGSFLSLDVGFGSGPGKREGLRSVLFLAFRFKGVKGGGHEDQDHETGDGNDVRLQPSALGQIGPLGKTERERETRGKHSALRCSGKAGRSGEHLGGGTPRLREAGCLLPQRFVWIQSLCCRAQKSLPPNTFLSRTMCHASALLLARTFLFFFFGP